MPTKTNDVLAEAFTSRPAKPQRCSLGLVLDQASEQARKLVQEALDDSDTSLNWIVTQLRAAGVPMGKDTVSAHRNGACRCGSR